MGEFKDALNRVEVSTSAAGGAVRVTVKRMNDTNVTVDQSCRSRFDEWSLAQEVETAVTEAWALIEEKLDKVAEQHNIARPPSDERAPWMLDALEELEQIEAKGVSGRQFVSAYATANGDLLIEFGANVVRRTDVTADVLGFEITEAIRTARRAAARDVTRVCEKFRPIFE